MFGKIPSSLLAEKKELTEDLEEFLEGNFSSDDNLFVFGLSDQEISSDAEDKSDKEANASVDEESSVEINVDELTWAHISEFYPTLYAKCQLFIESCLGDLLNSTKPLISQDPKDLKNNFRNAKPSSLFNFGRKALFKSAFADILLERIRYCIQEEVSINENEIFNKAKELARPEIEGKNYFNIVAGYIYKECEAAIDSFFFNLHQPELEYGFSKTFMYSKELFQLFLHEKIYVLLINFNTYNILSGAALPGQNTFLENPSFGPQRISSIDIKLPENLKDKQKIVDFVENCYQEFLQSEKTREILLQEQAAKSLEYLIDLSESEILLPHRRFILSYQSKKYDIKTAMKDLRENKNNEKVLNEFKPFIKERIAYYTRKIAKDFPLDPKYLTIDTAHEKAFKEHMKSISGFLFQMAILFFSEKDYLENVRLRRDFYNHLTTDTSACSFLSILKSTTAQSSHEKIETLIKEEVQTTRKRPLDSDKTTNQDQQCQPPAKKQMTGRHGLFANTTAPPLSSSAIPSIASNHLEPATPASYP